MRFFNTVLFCLITGVASAQVGIGTSTPTEALDVETNNATKTAIDINNSSTGDPLIHFQVSGVAKFTIGVDNDDSDKLKIGTTAVETSTSITINSSQQVGIGNTSPTATLDVDGDAIFNESGADKDFRVEGDAQTNLLFVDASADFVGIGTSAPSSLLHLSKDDATASAVVDLLTITKSTSGASAAGIGAGLVFQVEDGGDTEEQGRINVELDDVTDAAEDATMTFDINQNGTMTEVLRIDGTSGYVGIGVTAPAAKLDVEGDLILQNGSAIDEFSTDGTMAGNSDLAVPTEQAVVEYVAQEQPSLTKTITIESPTNTDYFPIFRTDVAITIVEALAMLNAGGDVDVRLYWDTDFAETSPTAIGTTTTLTTTSEATVNIGSDATIPADSWIFVDIPEATSAQTVTVSVRYTED